MTRWRLVLQTLKGYWRAQVAVGLAAAVGTAVLVGALAVGDSMRASLRQAMDYRLGSTQFAMVAPERYFSEALAARLEGFLSAATAPVLYARGLVRSDDGSKRVNQVHVYGVDDRFYALCPGVDPWGEESKGMVLNRALADRLEAEAGDSLLLRLERPEYLSREIVLVPDADRSVGSRQTVWAIVGPEQFGRFTLEANQAIPYNVFVPLAWLQSLIDREGLANTLLVGLGLGARAVTESEVNEAIQACWRLEDAQLELASRPRQGQLELSTPRVFIDEAVSETLRNADGLLTYFVNELRHDERATPYSMVTALGRGSQLEALPTDMRDDQIVISQWLADDLQAQVGDTLQLSYYVVGERRALTEEQEAFEVCRILPMTHRAIDPNLMPAFPGLAGVENCRDWEPGVEIDLDKLRDTDETYWDDYEGSPKAFLTLEAGQSIWASRYGKLTALRFDAEQVTPETLTQQILEGTDPAALGLFFMPVRARSETALSQGTDFGPLFLGLSMFLIVGAVILTGLLFGFSIESRRQQTGLFLALGLGPKLVRSLFVREGLVVALLGTLPGLVVGLLYARLLVLGLGNLWEGAIAHAAVSFAVTAPTCVSGALGGVVAAFAAMLVTLRRQFKYEPRALLAGDAVLSVAGKVGRQWVSLVIGGVALLASAALLFAPSENSQAASGLFFGAGFGLLVAALALCAQLLGRLAWRWHRPMVTLGGLAARNVSRRRGRSLAAIGLLAIGIFLVVSIRAFHKDPAAVDTSRSSGTGGFQWIGQASLGILHDLDTAEGRAKLGLDPQVLGETRWVPLRVHDGDDASCLNLNRAQTPRLLGVDANELADRGAFRFVKTEEWTGEHPWSLLNKELGPDIVPVIGDDPTVMWGLGKSVGDSLEYRDEAGKTFRTRIVGTIEGSVLQGNLLMAEHHFVQRFPSEAGYRMFLLETPEEAQTVVADHLSERLQDSGLVLTSTRERLAMFNEIQNTYLTMFSALGGLGLVLGTVGLGLVVMRTMLDRRAETAMLLAVGLSRKQLKRMLALEHWGLLAAGLLSGCLAALVAILPAMRSSSQVPYAALIMCVAGIGLSGAIWVWLATHVALQGPLLEGLRRE